MRILLIDPPYDRLIGFKSEWFPLGLTYIASFLIKKGYDEVAVYSAEHALDTEFKSVVKYSESFHRYREAINSADNSIWNEIREKVSSFEPDLVGISVLTPKVPSALRVAKICKEIDPNIKVIVGGHHPTIKPDEMLSNKDIDFVVRGEGEETLYEFIREMKHSASNYDAIPGLSFRRNGKVIHNINRRLIEDLDSLPFPALDKLLDLQTYSRVQLSMIMTSRGCPYNCSFCASRNMWGDRVRFRSINNILNEIYELNRRFHVRNITFVDDSFTWNSNRVKELCLAILKSNVEITWSCLTRVNVITDELIALMKKAGCTKVDIGIESGNQRVLNLINKKITLSQIRDTVKILKRNRIFWSGFFMFGFPTETEEEIFDTLNFLKELKPDWANISIFTPYPGTALYQISIEKGIIQDPPDYTLYSHQNPVSRCTDKIPEERFYTLANHVLSEVHRYDSSYKVLIKRALTRKYYKNPRILLDDINRVVSWLKK